MMLWPSLAVAKDTTYEQALQKARDGQYNSSDVLFERTWKSTPRPIVAYSWCMMLIDAKRDTDARRVCGLVDQTKLSPERAARVKRARQLLGSDQTTAPTKPNVTSNTNQTNDNRCQNAQGVCAGQNVSITNHGPKTMQSRMSTTGYLGIVSIGFGVLSGFWLNRELNEVEQYLKKTNSSRSSTEFERNATLLNNAQWRGRTALGGTILFGVGGVLLLSADLLTVETSVAIRATPTSLQFITRW